MGEKEQKKREEEGESREKRGKGVSGWDAGQDGVREHFKEGDSGCKEREKRKGSESKRVSIKVKDRQEEERDGGLIDRVALSFSM